MCNLYSITKNQAAIRDLFKVAGDSAGNLPPMPGVFPAYPAPVVRNTGAERELTMMRWGMPPPPRAGGYTVTVTAQVGEPVYDRRRELANSEGFWARASMMVQPCFLAVERKERMTAKSVAPSRERKPPDIFCRSFIMRPLRSA